MASRAKHDWPMVRLGDVCHLKYGKALKKEERVAGEFPVFGSAGSVGSHVEANFVGPVSVVGRKGSAGFVEWSSGNCWIIDTAFGVFPKSEEQVDSRWLYWLLKDLRLGRLQKHAAVPGISKADVVEEKFLLPPLDEQRRIAAILDAVAESIAAVKSQLAELSAIPFSMSNQKPQLIALSELVDIRSSQVDPTSEPYLTMPHVAPNNLYSGSDEIVGVKSAAEDGVTSGKYAFKSGDILYSKIRPYLNKVSVAAYDGVCSADMYALVPRDIKQTDWIVWQLRSSRFLAYAAASSGRASIPKINRKTLGAFEVQVADPTVLERFNREQSIKKSLADSMRRKLNLFQKLQESLSTRAFQGEL
ncbi:restriction endonuclease subunit S [Corynebacterium aurimucosum]|uniref:restriction endonuclease subunit S n=1 Tax=Corynebacterium aurimucosum TaxID=169292 RepID=UPI003990C26C